MLYTIFAGDKNKRLDKFLTKKLSRFSRSQIQKLIKDGGVLVNSKPAAVHRFLKEGDRVSFRPSLRRKSRGRAEESLKANQRQGIPRLRPSGFARDDIDESPIPEIIFEDDNILIINKPVGLLVHPRALELKDQEPTVVDWLLQHYPAIKTVGDQPELRPGLVHRLDKEASGVMVIAKTPEAFKHLKKQFYDHLVKKEYLALVYGQLKSNYGKIELSVGRAEKGGRMAARPPSVMASEAKPSHFKGGIAALLSVARNDKRSGKPSLTEFEVLEKRKNCTLIKVVPKTGRTHQIRVHFFALGHPLVGDPLYQSKKYKEIPAERLMLHAHKLTIKMLGGEERTFISPLPPEFISND